METKGFFQQRPHPNEGAVVEPTTLQTLLFEFYEQSNWPPHLAQWWVEHSIAWTDVAAFAGVLSLLPVRFFPGRFFDFDDGGMPAIIIEAIDEDAATTIDLVAWPVHRPEKFATALGRASGLGVDRVVNPASYYLGKPLKLFRTPLRWLQAGCDGAVILDPRFAPDWLSRALGDIAGEDLSHAREIASLLAGRIDVDRIVAPVEVP